jgi:hypothetical protein
VVDLEHPCFNAIIHQQKDDFIKHEDPDRYNTEFKLPRLSQVKPLMGV